MVRKISFDLLALSL